MNNYANFKRLFLTKSNGVLVSTVNNSKKRELALTQSGNAKGAAVEAARGKAAFDVLDMRGYYKSTSPAPEKAGTDTRTGQVNGSAIAIVAFSVLLLLVS